MLENLKNTISSTVDSAKKNPNLRVGTPAGQVPNLYRERGVGRSFDENKYKIENHSYPSDIMSSEYGGNYVVFYINVSEDSKMVKNKEENFVEDIDPRDRGDLVAKNYSAAEMGVATGIIGSGVGAAVGLGAGASGGGLIGAGLGVAAVGAVATQSPGFTRPQKRLQTAIALHIPNTLNISYGMQWEEDSTAGFATAAELGRVLGDTARAIIDSPTKIATAGTEILNGVKKMGPAATALGLAAAPSAVGAAAGLAPNPKKEQMFRGVDFRTFTFDYQFYPRDSQEAVNVLNIIQAFKYHMHPEFKDEGNFLYIYPSEFDIYYYNGPTENKNIHRHTSCVLTNMNINYTPNGQFTTFADGMPTQINITLSFKELALLTKDKIKDGM
jgi:hypothetical protein